jgi:hypothetical protein
MDPHCQINRLFYPFILVFINKALRIDNKENTFLKKTTSWSISSNNISSLLEKEFQSLEHLMLEWKWKEDALKNTIHIYIKLSRVRKMVISCALDLKIGNVNYLWISSFQNISKECIIQGQLALEENYVFSISLCD